MSDWEVWVRTIHQAFAMIQREFDLSNEEIEQVEKAIHALRSMDEAYRTEKDRIDEINRYIDRHGYGEDDEPEG